MKKLNISITKAQLTSFQVELHEGKPAVTITIALLTESGKQVTNYNISTDHWQRENKFDLPIEIMPVIGDIARILEAIAVRHCQEGQLALPPPAPAPSNTKRPVHAEIVIEDIDDSPINLDDIPF